MKKITQVNRNSRRRPLSFSWNPEFWMRHLVFYTRGRVRYLIADELPWATEHAMCALSPLECKALPLLTALLHCAAYIPHTGLHCPPPHTAHLSCPIALHCITFYRYCPSTMLYPTHTALQGPRVFPKPFSDSLSRRMKGEVGDFNSSSCLRESDRGNCAYTGSSGAPV